MMALAVVGQTENNLESFHPCPTKRAFSGAPALVSGNHYLLCFRAGLKGFSVHHYPFHVGDYIRATAHLDLIEDCVYRRLIDLYMETEAPIPNETQQVIRRLRLGSSGLILESILAEFFTLEDDNCWHNSRCDAEIQAYKRLAEVSRINGKLGGRPKKTKQVILANPAGTQQEPSGLQPRTKNQEPISTPHTPKGDDVRFEQFWKAYPRKQGKGAAEKAFAKAKLNGHFDSLLTALELQKRSEQWQKDGGQFIPNPATWLNQKRWEDEIPAGPEQAGQLFAGVL